MPLNNFSYAARTPTMLTTGKRHNNIYFRPFQASRGPAAQNIFATMAIERLFPDYRAMAALRRGSFEGQVPHLMIIMACHTRYFSSIRDCFRIKYYHLPAILLINAYTFRYLDTATFLSTYNRLLIYLIYIIILLISYYY